MVVLTLVVVVVVVIVVVRCREDVVKLSGH